MIPTMHDTLMHINLQEKNESYYILHTTTQKHYTTLYGKFT